MVIAWCGKNWYYFDTFGLSSWAPLSLYKTTLWNMPQAERDSLATAGVISVFSTQEPFGRVWRYGVPVVTDSAQRHEMFPNTPDGFVPILDVSEFAENGSNLNHWTYLQIAKAQKADVIWALKNHPEIFVRTAWASVRIAFKPASSYWYYSGHLGRRRHNADIVLGYVPWANTKEYELLWNEGHPVWKESER